MEEIRLILPARSQLAVRVQQAVSMVDRRGVFAGGTRRHSFSLLPERGTPIRPVHDFEHWLPLVYKQRSDRFYSRLMHSLAGGGERALLIVTDPREMQILGSPNSAAFDTLIGRSSSKLDEVLATFHPEQTYNAEAAA